ncbi:MAG: GNAT family N-acetyltransferase [Candidatus Riflebacteria bacterium]|nr:GNAT family N-acetyltransferase [Candidatus Riflebacteria bacterium]
MTDVRPLYLPPPCQDSPDCGAVIMRDGSTASIRIAQPLDRDAISAFFKNLLPEAGRERFFSLAESDREALDILCNPSEPRKQLTLIASRIVDGTSRIIGLGSYVAVEEAGAELAMAVGQTFQGMGLGTLLLERLALLAVNHGFVHLLAISHSEASPLLGLFRNSGFELAESSEDGRVRVDLSVVPRQESVARTEMRDRLFTAASLRPFFKPRSVAVVGASREPTAIGYRLLEQVVTHRFRGPVYPVNPKATEILELKAYPSVKSIPDPVDLAFIVVPPRAILAAIDDCAARGVKALVVITAGFAEQDQEGRRLQQTVVDRVRGYGMRMVGPNCLGLLNADPAVSLNGSFSPVFPASGRVAMYSQCGALGMAVLGHTMRVGLGVSAFVSVGNKADVTGNDLLQYWEEDPGTDVILAYLESLEHPRRFARIARRVSRSKPIVCVKSGRTATGRRAAGSHTAALASSETGTEALFRQAGVVRAETLEEMFDLAGLLATQPLPEGRRLAILTNAGGPAVLCADTGEAGGLILPELSSQTKERLYAFLPSTASVANPVDMIAAAGPSEYERAIQVLLTASEVDSLIVMYVSLGDEYLNQVLQAIDRGVTKVRKECKAHKTVLACIMAGGVSNQPLQAGEEKIPTYFFPEAAARALSKVTDYADWRKKPLGVCPSLTGIDPGKAREVCRNALSTRGEGWLSAEELRSVLVAFGLPVPQGGVARSADEAAEIARRIGYPVALKIASTTIVHKTEMGGVRLGIKDEEQVRQAFEETRMALEQEGRLHEVQGVLVQPMLAGGVEVMVGVTEDPLFGPLIAFGRGGVHVEILGDVVFRVTPLTDVDAQQMVRGIKGFRLLQGYRGHPPADVPALENVLLRISRLVEEVPEIGELDLNPIFALPPGKGCWIADARIRVQAVVAGRPMRYVLPSPAR